MRTKLTKRIVEAAKPGARDTIVWDTDLKGFGCKITPKGHKAYFLYYRTRDGQQRRPLIGEHGAVTCEEARATAKAWHARVAMGADPSAERQDARKISTVGEAADRYLSEHVATRNRPSMQVGVTRLVKTRIKPQLGSTRLDKLTRAKVASWHHGMAATPYEANRALACLSKIMALAATKWELIRETPCRGVAKFPEHKRERFYSDAELSRIGSALADAETTGREPAGVLDAIKLLAVTGCRLGEIRTLRWEHVDLDKGALRLPDAKAGARTVPLGAVAKALLESMPRAGEYVIRGSGLDKPLTVSIIEKAWYRIRATAKVPDGRLHDFRHTAGTYAAQGGANAFMVRDLLGHKTLAMTGRYVERAIDPLRATADAVANRVSAAMAGKSAEVIPLDRSRA